MCQGWGQNAAKKMGEKEKGDRGSEHSLCWENVFSLRASPWFAIPGKATEDVKCLDEGDC